MAFCVKSSRTHFLLRQGPRRKKKKKKKRCNFELCEATTANWRSYLRWPWGQVTDLLTGLADGLDRSIFEERINGSEERSGDKKSVQFRFRHNLTKHKISCLFVWLTCQMNIKDCDQIIVTMSWKAFQAQKSIPSGKNHQKTFQAFKISRIIERLLQIQD